MNFKIGDKVRIIKSVTSVDEKDGGKGIVGVVKVTDGGPIGVESKEFTFDFKGLKKLWWFMGNDLELVDGEPLAQASQSQSQYNTVCVRCGAPAYFGLNKVECSRECNNDKEKEV